MRMVTRLVGQEQCSTRGHVDIAYVERALIIRGEIVDQVEGTSAQRELDYTVAKVCGIT